MRWLEPETPRHSRTKKTNGIIIGKKHYAVNPKYSPVRFFQFVIMMVDGEVEILLIIAGISRAQLCGEMRESESMISVLLGVVLQEAVREVSA